MIKHGTNRRLFDNILKLCDSLILTEYIIIMKKLLFLLMLLPLGLCAQVYTVRKYQNENVPASVKSERDSIINNLKLTPAGVYERSEIVYANTASAQDLYLIVMQTLSDWTGTNGRIDAGLDFYDKESGIINYKGKFYLGTL